MKKITVITNSAKDIGYVYTNQVTEILSQFDCTITQLDYIDSANVDADFIICLGGDGTIIKVAASNDVPILGINLGRLGYIAELESDEISMITGLFNGEYKLENRMMLTAEFSDGRSYNVLNDVVLSHGMISRIADIELRCDSNIVSRYRGDGLIVATPTGSTAYSMSAGGPVIDPRIDCICVTPICSHSLKAKPLIFTPESELEMINKCTDKADMYVTFDGNGNIPLIYDESVKIIKSNRTTQLVRMKIDGFYNILYNKMSDN